jgi:hypothetical protein
MPAYEIFLCGISDSGNRSKFVLLREINRFYSLFPRQNQCAAPPVLITHQIDANNKMKSVRFQCKYRIHPRYLRISLSNVTRYTPSIAFKDEENHEQTEFF